MAYEIRKKINAKFPKYVYQFQSVHYTDKNYIFHLVSEIKIHTVCPIDIPQEGIAHKIPIKADRYMYRIIITPSSSSNPSITRTYTGKHYPLDKDGFIKYSSDFYIDGYMGRFHNMDLKEYVTKSCRYHLYGDFIPDKKYLVTTYRYDILVEDLNNDTWYTYNDAKYKIWPKKRYNSI